jgi:monoterpene epsilon-lactone hydrolase
MINMSRVPMMLVLRWWCSGLVAATSGFLLVAMQAHASAEPAAKSTTNATIDNQGTIRVPPFEIPLSSYMSWEAKQAFIQLRQKGFNSADQAVWQSGSLLGIRELFEKEMAPKVERAKAVFAVNIVEQKIGGVRTRVITPKNGVAARNRDRVLINLHGGGFFEGAEGAALAESIPIAGTAKIKVVTVDYRQGPEYIFPAASEDVAAVYKALLEHYKPKSIGIYGCSSGGILTAMAAAWLQEKNVPAPGALALWSSGAFANWDGNPLSVGSWGGDSAYLGPVLDGGAPLPVDSDPTLRVSMYLAYLNKADLRSSLVSPAESPAVLAKFPPTLLITGTRGWDMSAAVETHRRLVKAGIETDLHLWDGVSHCFVFDVDLPESKEAYDVTSRFFDRHLASPKSR